MKATARYGQWLGDVALAKTGALEGVWALALRNGLSVTSELTTGQELEWQPEDMEDSGVAMVYQREEIEPATGVTALTMNWLVNGTQPRKRVPQKEIMGDVEIPQPTTASVFGVEFTAAFS